MNAETKILIVDDDLDLLKLLTFRLQGAGYLLDSADSPERALAKLSVSVPHLVITDLRMGGMDGMALFQNIRKSEEQWKQVDKSKLKTWDDEDDWS